MVASTKHMKTIGFSCAKPVEHKALMSAIFELQASRGRLGLGELHSGPCLSTARNYNVHQQGDIVFTRFC